MQNDEYRIIDYKPHWYLEKLKSPGVYKIIGDFRTKEEAQEALDKILQAES